MYLQYAILKRKLNIFVGAGSKTHETPRNNKKARCLTNESQILFKPRKFSKDRTSNDLNVEAIRYSKCNSGKSGMKFIEFTTKVSKFPNVLYFRQHHVWCLLVNYCNFRRHKLVNLRSCVN